MRIDLCLDPFGPTHPRLGPNGLHPIDEARDEAEVLLNMLLADPAGRDDTPGREGEGRAENRLGHEDALRMVAQRPVPKVGCDLLALVYYVDSTPAAAFCPMLDGITPESLEALMFKLTASANGGTILVTDLKGNPVDPICRFAAYLLAKAYSPNTALAYARDLIHLWTFLSTQGIHWTAFSPELSVAFLGHLRSVPANRKRRALRSDLW